MFAVNYPMHLYSFLLFCVINRRIMMVSKYGYVLFVYWKMMAIWWLAVIIVKIGIIGKLNYIVIMIICHWIVKISTLLVIMSNRATIPIIYTAFTLLQFSVEGVPKNSGNSIVGFQIFLSFLLWLPMFIC